MRFSRRSFVAWTISVSGETVISSLVMISFTLSMAPPVIFMEDIQKKRDVYFTPRHKKHGMGHRAPVK
jgi:hypothetical protein